MLRILIIIVFQTLFSVGFSQDNNFSIRGKFDGTNGTPIFLKYTRGSKTIIDTTILRNNSFVFNGNVDNPTQAYVTNQINIIQFMPFFMLCKNDDITIDLDKNNFEKIIVKGSDYNWQLNDYRSYYKYCDSIFQIKITDLDREKDDSLVQIYSKIKKNELATYCKNFIEHNPNSHISVFLLYDVLNENELLADSLFQTLSPNIQKSNYGIKCKSAIDFKSLSAIGKKAPDFILNDSSGVAQSLNSFKGKYILVDFWASWCGPCRAETPNLLKAYQTFKNKNFEVIGVSIDDGYHFLAWKDAIVKDQTKWLQLLDDKNANVADAYGISYIPANVLINPQGIIIAKNIIGQNLWQTLNKYLKN